MSKYIKLKDVEKVIDRFAGYLDDDMIYRIKYKINHDCQLFEEFTSKGKWVHIGGDAYRDWETDRKSTRLNSSHRSLSRMPSSA